MKVLLLSCLLLLGWLGARAQAPADSSLVASAVRAAGQRYYAAAPLAARLLNGTEYVDHTKSFVQGTQFYPSAKVLMGSLQYDGFYFAAVPLRYDCHADRVVVLPPGWAVHVQLIAEKVTSFTVDGHHFVRLVTDSVATPRMRTGFYDVLADGPAQLLAKHSRHVNERSTQQGMEGYYSENIRFFVRKDATYYEVSQLKDVLKLYPNNKAELQKFARSQRLSFKDDRRENSLAALLGHYNTLVR